ncbi:MAG TPA: hypothetical protein VFT04_05685 [Gemmatimonadales bacterium]|nr:hypothetical protein [Gemmatimonadales bacterium]
MSTPRRDFLGWFGASALVAASAPLAALEPPERPSRPVDGTWDMAWVDRITGKYRAVFDSPELSEGAALFRACLWRDQYKEVYGVEHGDMTPVLVIRHGAIAMAMDDGYWEQFRIGKEAKLKNPKTKKWEVANPFRATPPGTPERYAAYSLEGFMGSGGIVLACNLAFQQAVWKYREAEKLTREAATDRARQHLIAGIILQPSGVFATLRAQEAGCGYILAS